MLSSSWRARKKPSNRRGRNARTARPEGRNIVAAAPVARAGPVAPDPVRVVFAVTAAIAPVARAKAARTTAASRPVSRAER